MTRYLGLIITLVVGLWVNADAIAKPIQTTQAAITCNNALTDATTINSAINASAAGAEIVIGGHCLLNQTIRLLGNRSYRGESRTGTVLKQADNTSLVALLASDSFLDNKPHTGAPISLRHLTLHGNKQNNRQAATAGLILRSWLSVVEDILITEMSSDGLRLTSKSLDGTLVAVSQVNGRISSNMIENSGRHGIFVEDPKNIVTDWIVRDNWIANSGMDALHLDNAAGWMIEGNHLYGVPQTAIYANRLYGTSIINNYIEGFGETSQTGTWYGIYGTVQGGAASTIMGNRIFNFDGDSNRASSYLYVALTVNYKTGIVSVVGNTIRGDDPTLGVGFAYVADEGKSLIVTSTGNAVEGVKTQRSVIGQVTLSAGL